MAEFNIYWQDTLRTWLAWKGEAKDTDEALDKAARTLGQVWIVKFRSPYLMYHDGEEFLTLRLVDFFAPRYSRRIEKARKQKQVTLYHFGFHTGAFMAGEYEKFWKARKRKPLPPKTYGKRSIKSGS